MKINIPKVVRPIRLSDYAPEFGEQAIQMWVNPPRELRLRYFDITEDYKAVRDQLEQSEEGDDLTPLVERVVELANGIYAWYAEMWSQGGGEWTMEDVQEFAQAAMDTDPALWDFVQESSLDVLQAYRRQKKADSPGPQGSP